MVENLELRLVEDEDGAHLRLLLLTPDSTREKSPSLGLAERIADEITRLFDSLPGPEVEP